LVEKEIWVGVMSCELWCCTLGIVGKAEGVEGVEGVERLRELIRPLVFIE